MKPAMRLTWLVNQLKAYRAHPPCTNYSTMVGTPIYRRTNEDTAEFPQSSSADDIASQAKCEDARTAPVRQIGENVSRKDKISLLVTTLMDLRDGKEAIYGTLDAWVAWERNFPIGPLKNVLLGLEKEQQWHRIIQVIKWMLSKGQGNTRGTYGQLIEALDKDHRVKEAHEIWKEKLAFDLHSVPWKLCKLMISIYFRNNMHEDLVKLFKDLESFDRKPPERSIVRKVADAYELLGLPEEKERILEKYKDLLAESPDRKPKKTNSSRSMSKKKPDSKKRVSVAPPK